MTGSLSAGVIRERIEALDGGEVDVVILGAGVNGAGLFRDLCEQGVTCLLVDKADVCAGTSAAPSRLIHGGLKYLETGEFGLVAQSTLERNLLLRNAPHLVKPLETIIPIFSWTKGVGAALRTLVGSTTAPRSRGALLVKLGLALYDLYGARRRVMPRHRLLSRRRALATLPGLTDRIVAAGSYFDARVTSPERLVWELVADGLAAARASAVSTYTALVAADAGTLTFAPEDGARFAVRPRIVVNAAGPWIDAVNAALGEPTAMIGGTKGSHILLAHDDLVARLAGRMVYFEADDGRICLVFDHLGRALVGSTDARANDPDAVRCQDDEIAYFLASLTALFPGLAFDRSQIVYAYSGIRPLPASGGTAAGLISRDHSAPVLEPAAGRPFPIVSLVGGKWTTFRGFAQEVADATLARLGRSRRVSTEALPIGGGRDYPPPAQRADWVAQVAAATDRDPARVATLLARYGTTARAIVAHCGDATALSDGTMLGEVDYIARNEGVKHLADIVMRRTTLAIGGTLTRADLAAVADVAAAALGWTAEQTRAEVDACADRLTAVNRMTLPAAQSNTIGPPNSST